MKTIFAVLALLVASCCAVPAPMKSLDAPEQTVMMPEKGEAPIEESHKWTKGEEKMVEETSGEFWIPFWDFFSNVFSKKEELPTPNNEVRMAKPVPMLKKPQRADFDNSDEFLEELNTFHFGESSESRELVQVESQEVRHANHKAPEHVRDAIIYNKVMPKREDYDDYGDFLEETNRHMMGTVVHKKAEPKVKSTWSSWFGKW